MVDSSRDFGAAGLQLPLAGFVLDLASEELRDAAGHPIELRPQAFQVLRFLALNAGRLVTKEERLAAVWPGVVVTDDSLVHAIGEIRRALGADGQNALRTVPRRGCTIVADAVTVPKPNRDATPAPAGPAASAGTIEGPGAEPAVAPVATHRALRPWVAFAVILLVALSTGAIVFWRSGSGDMPAASAALQRMPERPSIAVLMFDSPGGGAEDGELARGVAEDLIAELARNRDLRVVGCYSGFKFTGSATPATQIRLCLGSRCLVDGTARRDGETLRIGVEMIDAHDGHVVWSSQLETDSRNLPATRDALLRRIAGTVHSRVRHTEERGLLERTIELDPELPAAHFAQALAYSEARDFQAALASTRRCVAVGPSDVDCWMFLGRVQLALGMVEAALDSAERAADLVPLPPPQVLGLRAGALWAARRHEEAVRVATECLGMAPKHLVCRRHRLATLAEMGRLDAARQDAVSLLDLVPGATTALLSDYFDDSAVELRQRQVAAALATGIPPADTSTVAKRP